MTTELDTGDWKKTACILCAVNCGLEVQTSGARITRMRGDKANPVSQGYVCEKSQRMDHYQNGADRIDSPLRRRADGSYERIDWDTALREIAAKLADIRARHGGESIFFYGGGSQGNHLGGTYADSTLKALGVKYRSNALAQEKTGEGWVQGKMMGCGVHGDFEHCEVAVFVGKNPWQSHGFARARTLLTAIRHDPARTLIVIDPRRSETAAMADIHLAVRPGTDAWCLAALAAILVQDGPARARLARRAHDRARRDRAGAAGDPGRRVRAPLRRRRGAAAPGGRAHRAREERGDDRGPRRADEPALDAGELAAAAGVAAGRPLRAARAPTTRSCRCSGSPPSRRAKATDRKEGSDGAPSPWKRSPVTQSRIIMGLVPCNVIPEEILTDHPKRFRAMWIESANPAHSLADTQRMCEAIRALELSVVVDVAMTETARQADYVLPATSQFEKAEATFFNLEFPRNGFHLRQPLFAPRPGTLTEAEIHARLLEAMGELSEQRLPLPAQRGALRADGVRARVRVGVEAQSAHRALRVGGALPHARHAAAAASSRRRRRCGASPAVRAPAAGGRAPRRLRRQRARRRQRAVPGDRRLAVGRDLRGQRVRRQLEGGAAAGPPDRARDSRAARRAEVAGRTSCRRRRREFPFVLSAGERRSDTSNTAVRDVSWHRKGAYGTLRMHPADAAALGCADGDWVRIVTGARRRGGAGRDHGRTAARARVAAQRPGPRRTAVRTARSSGAASR